MFKITRTQGYRLEGLAVSTIKTNRNMRKGIGGGIVTTNRNGETNKNRFSLGLLLLAITIPVKNRGKIRTKFILILNDNDGSLVWKRRTAWVVYIFRAGSCKI